MFTGAVAVTGIWLNSGAKNSARTNSKPMTIEENPVRLPSLIPAADSTYTMSGVVPMRKPNDR
jgi:hypothetical protein